MMEWEIKDGRANDGDWKWVLIIIYEMEHYRTIG